MAATPVTPRCLIGLSRSTLEDLRRVLEAQKGTSADVDAALDQLIEMAKNAEREAEGGTDQA